MVAPTWLGNPGLSSIQRVVWSFDRLSALKLEDSPSMISNFNGWQTSQLAASHVWSLEATVLFSFSVCMTWWTHEKFPKKGPRRRLRISGYAGRRLKWKRPSWESRWYESWVCKRTRRDGWMDGRTENGDNIHTTLHTHTHTHSLSLPLPLQAIDPKLKRSFRPVSRHAGATVEGRVALGATGAKNTTSSSSSKMS